MDTTIRYPLIS